MLVAFGGLFVADRGNHRVVVFAPVPTTSGASAIAALGQDNLTSNAYAPGAPSQDRIGAPTDVTALGDKLFVADYEWDRVLRFDLNP